MLCFKYKVADRRGLHARNAVSINRLAMEYECRITLRAGSAEADCKNVMSLMNLHVSENDTVEFVFEGRDESEAAKLMESTLPTFL